jgi:rhamnose utilization protein RhaD (predicted bifunctional aldolase and dehydrogenase)
MTQLGALVNISRYYGGNPAYVIAGGGNTSYKDESQLFIKASGISLATIGRDGFVCMSRDVLGRMEEADYPEDPAEREAAVKADLKRAIIRPENLRPSVETSLHNLIGYAYVIHTHPTLVNALMCSHDAGREVEERFGSEAIYMEYADPGYVLFRELRARVRGYELTYGMSPKIIFLQNHGIFVGANSTREVKAIYDSIESRIRQGRDLSLPSGEITERSSPVADLVAGYCRERGRVSGAYECPLCKHFSQEERFFRKISRPFTPDNIVYCKSHYLFLKAGLSDTQVLEKLEAFRSTHGYVPRVIVEERGGLILTEENERSLQTVLEVFHDMMKISYLSEQFGGPHSMSDEQIRFIDSWEVENYRRNIARSS